MMPFKPLVLAGVAFVGSVFWVVSPEAAAVYYGAQGHNPLLLGVLCAAPQMIIYAILYFGGEVLVARWGWLHRQVVRTRERFGHRLEGGYLGLTVVGAMSGIPPILAMVSLAGGFEVRAHHVLPVTFVGRMVRFTSLAALGSIPTVAHWFNAHPL